MENANNRERGGEREREGEGEGGGEPTTRSVGFVTSPQCTVVMGLFHDPGCRLIHCSPPCSLACAQQDGPEMEKANNKNNDNQRMRERGREGVGGGESGCERER